MLDSCAKIPVGITSGNVFELGAFDDCLAIENGDKTIKGKYCLTGLTPSKNFYKTLAIAKNELVSIRIISIICEWVYI